MQQTGNIKERLLTRFGTLGGESPPAAVEKIADVIAQELKHLQVEQEQSEERIRNGLAKKINGYCAARRKPAAAILQVLPDKADESRYSPEDHLEIENEQGQKIFLSPLYAVELQPVRIAYRYWNGQLRRQINAAHTENVQPLQNIPPGAKNEILLGIHVSEGATLPAEIMLHISAENGIAGYETKRVLPELRAETDENIFPLTAQPYGTTLPSENVADWRERHFLLKEIEQPIAEKYKDSFLRIEGFDRLPQTTIVAVLQQVVQMLQGEKIYWLKLVFPITLTEADVAEMTFGFNCFPVLNRRIRRREESPDMPLTTFPLRRLPEQQRNPLDLPEHFLGLQKIFYGSGREFKPAIVSKFAQAQPGEYGIQQGGVLSFHAEEARRQLAYTLTLLETEKEVLQNAYGQRLQHGEIERHFRQIRDSMDFLQRELEAEKVRADDWYLHCKPVNERENVLVRFWVGQECNLKEKIIKK